MGQKGKIFEANLSNKIANGENRKMDKDIVFFAIDYARKFGFGNS